MQTLRKEIFTSHNILAEIHIPKTRNNYETLEIHLFHMLLIHTLLYTNKNFRFLRRLFH